MYYWIVVTKNRVKEKIGRVDHQICGAVSRVKKFGEKRKSLTSECQALYQCLIVYGIYLPSTRFLFQFIYIISPHARPLASDLDTIHTKPPAAAASSDPYSTIDLFLVLILVVDSTIEGNFFHKKIPSHITIKSN